MKILMTTDTAGGVWHYSLDLVNCLLQEQIAVVLVALGPKPERTQLVQLEKLPGITFYHIPGKLEWMDDPWEDVEVADSRIKEIFRKEQPDILHFNNYAHVGRNWDCPVVLVAHSCVASWWLAVKREPLPARFNRYFETVKNALHAADIVITPTTSILQIYEQLYGPLPNAEVIYNGLSIPEVRTKKQPILFSMGRLWDEAKNINLLLQAAKQIHGKIYIAGSNEGISPHSGNITFLGQLSRQEIFDWLNISAIYVLPVKYEPFGLSFLEAASHKCALLGGDIPTLRELWKNTMTYTSPGNPRELAKACNKLLDDQKYGQLMGEKAYEKAKNYTLEKKKNRYIQLYAGLQETASNANYNKNVYL